MLLLPNHALEVFWLKRRIQFLEQIDNLASIDAEPDEFVSGQHHEPLANCGASQATIHEATYGTLGCCQRNSQQQYGKAQSETSTVIQQLHAEQWC